MFCTNCGNQLPENANVCPYCGTAVRQSESVQPAYQQPVNPYPVNPRPLNTEPVRTPFPVLAISLGLAGAILSYFGYFLSLLYRNTISGILPVLGAMLGICGVVFGIVGLIRSIRTNGRRKYVAGIVLSAIGLSGGAVALLLSFFGVLLRSFIGRYM